MTFNDDIKRRWSGFALGELLVVIGVLTIGAAVLVPAVSENRMRAMSTACQSNLKSWGFVFDMHTNDNDGYFWEAWSDSRYGHLWMYATEPYRDDPDMFFCPVAKKPRAEDASSSFPGEGLSSLGARNVNEAWGRFSEETSESRLGYRGVAGSYGINQWIGKKYDSSSSSRYWSKQVNGERSEEIPLLLDCTWLGGKPDDSDNPPPTSAGVYTNSGYGPMQRFMSNRHGGAINGVFMDGSVRRVSLKELWMLKWHGEFENKDPSKNRWISKNSHWPAWMKNFDDDMLLD